jgi:hypothetical protein
MLVTDESVALAGYFGAEPGQPGFVVPLFKGRHSNQLLVQDIGTDGRISGFRSLEPRSFKSIDAADVQRAAGDAPLMGFLAHEGVTHFAEREDLQRLLAPIADAFEPPFLRLQLAQFCEGPDAVVGAWRNAYRLLAERAPRSADAWRDVVIIPTQMRVAVHSAIVDHGLNAQVDALGHDVEVHVEEGEILLRLSRALHDALMAHDEARKGVERALKPITRAFDMNRPKLRLETADDEPFEPVESAVGEGVAIAAFGNMAISLLREVDPNVPALFPVPRAGLSPAMVPVEGWKSELFVEYRSADDLPRGFRLCELEKIGGLHRVVFAVFELSRQRDGLIHSALALARDLRVGGHLAIAVIPHFPEEPNEGSAITRDMLPLLEKEFDAVWFLGDRSPHTQSSLAYGPGRSAAAAATHFRYLLGQAAGGNYKRLVFYREPGRPSFGAVASVSGERLAPTLLTHAMMRLSHYLFDLDGPLSVHALSNVPAKELKRAIEDMVEHGIPPSHFDMDIEPHVGGGKSLTLALRNIALREPAPERFKSYCLDQLQRYGWSSRASDEADLAIASHASFDSVPVSFRFAEDIASGSAIRARYRRKQTGEIIMLTNSLIHRRSFVVNVLNGAVPIHYSRIASAAEIFRRRHSYVLNFIRGEEKSPLSFIAAAAIDIVNLQPIVIDNKLGRAKLVAPDTAELRIGSDFFRIEMPVIFSRRGSDGRPDHGHARMHYHAGGWQIDSVLLTQNEGLPGPTK